MADHLRRWPAALGGIAAGAAGLALVLGGVGMAESVLTGGQTRVWCEGTQGYDSPTGGTLERCVRERNNGNLVAPDEHLVEFYGKDTNGTRYEAHPWPVDGDAEVEFGDDSVTVINGAGVRASYPNSVFDDAR